MRILLAAALAASVGGAQPQGAPAVQSAEKATGTESRQEFRAIMRAVFADDRLWLLSDDGKMVTIRQGAGVAETVQLPGPARDLCTWQNSPLVVTGARDARVWTLRRYDGAQWKSVASIPVKHGELVALNCTGERVTLLTSDRLIEIAGGSIREVPLSERLGRGLVTSTAFSINGSLFVGLNAGEWGGGLKRIDRLSGKVSTIERNATGDLCDGPLNSSCDPVNAVAIDPWKPKCVVAAIGLVHFAPHGRLVEVCGNDVERLYFKPYDDGWGKSQPRKNGEPFSTVAFFGLARGADGLIAAGIDGLYRLHGPGQPQFVPLPKFRNIGGYWVSFDLPDFILVLTNINQRASISGATPILVTRQPSP